MPVRHLFFVRHTEYNEQTGRLDPEGIEKAILVRQKIKEVRFSQPVKVLASPALRAAEMALILAEGLTEEVRTITARVSGVRYRVNEEQPHYPTEVLGQARSQWPLDEFHDWWQTTILVCHNTDFFQYMHWLNRELGIELPKLTGVPYGFTLMVDLEAMTHSIIFE